MCLAKPVKATTITNTLAEYAMKLITTVKVFLIQGFLKKALCNYGNFALNIIESSFVRPVL